MTSPWDRIALEARVGAALMREVAIVLRDAGLDHWAVQVAAYARQQQAIADDYGEETAVRKSS